MSGLPRVSFEIFPPATEAGFEKLEAAQAVLNDFNPDYWSLTFGAQNADQDKSVRAVVRLAGGAGTLRPHITASSLTPTKAQSLLESWHGLGIRHLLVLRGDQAVAGETIQSSLDLLTLARRVGDFDFSVAFYPEGHADSRSAAADIEYLKHKQDLGATRAISQFFYDTSRFLSFRDRAVAAGVTLDLVPGILPVHDLGRVIAFAQRCGASLPLDLREAFLENPSRGESVAVEKCLSLCLELIAEDVPALHFYTLNQSQIVLRTLHALEFFLSERFGDYQISQQTIQHLRPDGHQQCTMSTQQANHPRHAPGHVVLGQQGHQHGG